MPVPLNLPAYELLSKLTSSRMPTGFFRSGNTDVKKDHRPTREDYTRLRMVVPFMIT